jgi:F0F1-type ATP synthase membrane subunit b/b'
MEAVPLAPTSTDNNTVILWVVLVLVAVTMLVGKVLWAKMQENDARQREEIAKAQARAEAAQAELLKVHGGVILEQTKTQAATNSAMGRMADVAEKMTAFVEKSTK